MFDPPLGSPLSNKPAHLLHAPECQYLQTTGTISRFLPPRKTFGVQSSSSVSPITTWLIPLKASSWTGPPHRGGWPAPLSPFLSPISSPQILLIGFTIHHLASSQLKVRPTHMKDSEVFRTAITNMKWNECTSLPNTSIKRRTPGAKVCKLHAKTNHSRRKCMKFPI